ncbi:MAG: glycosyltransferase family 2 protein [Acidimicrobiia bacterium]|nr:glycosyltransferase family 2 protein [Acidimicrobiia bacterium]
MTEELPPGPSVGLVITTYMGEDLIDQTLGSVAAQSRVPDQIVLVDDHSSDLTAKRAQRWTDILPMEVIVQPRNSGVARARNVAAARLGTDLLTILDGDDLLLPDHVEVLTALHRIHGGLVSPRARFWIPGRSPKPYQRRIRGFIPPKSDQLARLIQRNYVFVASLVSMDDFERVGGFAEGDRDLDTTADWDLWLRLVARGHPVTMARQPTVLYRVVTGSMADDTANLLRCEITQLERSARFLDPRMQRHVALAIANREAELEVLAATRRGERGRLAALAAGRSGGDWRNRTRALIGAGSPAVADRYLRRRGGW